MGGDVMHCTSDGNDVGSMMVQMGMAWDYSKYSGDYYQFEEDLARKEKRGILGLKQKKSRRRGTQRLCGLFAPWK